MRFSICLETFYPQLEPAERLRRLRAAGFRAVEFWSPYDKDLTALKSRLTELEMELICFSAHRHASPVRPDALETFLDEVKRNVATAQELNCPALMVLSDALEPDGAAKPAPFSDERKLLALQRALERAVLLAKRAGITLLLEPLNLRDHPGVFLHSSDTAAALVEHVDSPCLRLLVDVYHLQRQEGHVLETLERSMDHLGHLHLADLPGRHEPGTGELNVTHILKTLHAWGYRGTVGFECFPSRDEASALTAIEALISPFKEAG